MYDHFVKMQVTTENGKENCKLAQLKCVLKNPQFKNEHDIKLAIDKLKNLDCKISATVYLQSNHANWIGNTALHFAAVNRNSDFCRMLLDLGADFTLKNNNNLTALHEKLVYESLILEKHTLDDTIVHLILSAHLKYSIFQNPSNNSGLSHFHIACAANNAELVKGFLQNGVLINQTVKVDCLLFPGFTALHFAAKYCAYATAEILLSLGANIHAKDAKGMTPLLLALEIRLKIMTEAILDKEVRHRNEKVLKLFLEQESCNDMMIIDDWGLFHLHVACTLKDLEIAGKSLQRVKNINHAVNMNSSLWPGYSALHFVALSNIDIVKLLVKNGADMTIKDAKGVTPFDVCLEKYTVEDISAILSLHPVWKNIMLSDCRTKLTDLVYAMSNLSRFTMILKKPNKRLNIEDSPLWPGYTPMHLAVLFFEKLSQNDKEDASEDINLEILRKLFEKDIGMLCCQDAHGYTPLHLAYRLNKKVVVDLLLKLLILYPRCTNVVDEDGLSYVHIASAQNNVLLLERMLLIGSDVDATFQGKYLISRMIYPGSTALHFAVISGSPETVETLMKKGADVYAKNANGMTPIHLLLWNFRAKNLLSAPNLRDSVVRGIGLSHLHVACWWNQRKIVKRLLNYGASVNGIINCKPNVNEEPSVSSLLEPYAGYSPLLMAYEKNCFEIVELLLERGADFFVQNAKGKPLFYIACDELSTNLNGFLVVLRKNEDMQRRLQAETGMGQLHIACLDLDADAIEKSIDEGADVNQQIRFDSPIFRGYTPLHIVFQLTNGFYVEETIEMIELLINKGADVTLPNAASDTAIHMVYELFKDDNTGMMRRFVNVLLEAQRDFSVDPVNIRGISHFHIACRVFNASVVEEFLKNTDVDIDRPMDFLHDDFPGYTPLHLAASSLKRLNVDLEQLDTVDVLLKHGANVHAEDSFGDTQLHKCFYYGNRSGSLDVFERIARTGADVNARNLIGNTPLYYYLDSDNITFEGIKILLTLGCRLSTFSAFTDHGYTGKILSKFQHEVLPTIFFAMTVNYRQEMKNDCIGRTVIHNMVSDDAGKTLADTYATIFDQLARTGCDVDDEDKLGRTALHMAAKFNNAEGILGLLMAGADINTSDNNGKTAFSYNVDKCNRCEAYNEKSNKSDEEQCKHLETLETLAAHVNKLQMWALDVSEQNKDFAFKFFKKLKSETAMSKQFFEELETIKNTTIGSQSLPLSDFLSETGAVADYPRMSLIKRNDINKFFSTRTVQELREKFPELAGILQLQYKKARARSQLMGSARNVLTVLIGFRLPDICSDYILVLLKNSELKSLIATAT